MYFKISPKHTSLCDILGKSKEISQDIRKRFVDLQMASSSLGTITRSLNVLHSSIQTNIDKDLNFWKHDLWSNEATIERFDYKDHHYVSLQACEHHHKCEVRGWEHHVELHKVNGVMRKEY